MTDNYVPRSLETVLRKAVGKFPAVVLIGPRQSGKTTLLKHLYGLQYQMLSLEAPDIQTAAIHDPRGFLNLYRPPVIFDEIQYAPGLMPYIKDWIEAHRDLPGQFILTSSQNLLLMQQITESLAGRAAILKLLPMSNREIQNAPKKALPWETPSFSTISTTLSSPEIWGTILRGFYPEVACNPQRDARLWQVSYIQTYLERDVRNLRNIGDLTLFQNFLRALAARSAQLLNLSELARDIGVAVNTVKDWLSILEISFQVFILRPYYKNIGKRLVKSPKVYFTDTGLLCYLVGLRDAQHAASGPMGGAIFENLVAAEVYNTYLHQGEEPATYFWRTATGTEVDLIIETHGKLYPIEVKATSTPRPEMATGIEFFRKDYAGKVDQGYVIHTGEVVLPLGDQTIALPYQFL